MEGHSQSRPTAVSRHCSRCCSSNQTIPRRSSMRPTTPNACRTKARGEGYKIRLLVDRTCCHQTAVRDEGLFLRLSLHKQKHGTSGSTASCLCPNHRNGATGPFRDRSHHLSLVGGGLAQPPKAQSASLCAMGSSSDGGLGRRA